jgi:predicted acylesterase/phospholipase RssA
MHDNNKGRGHSRARIILVMVGVMVLAACSATERQSYHAAEAMEARIAGFDTIRTYLDAPLPVEGDPDEWMSPPGKKDINLLVISGGGAGGAFAVGVLAAWTKKGDRPDFDIVTGVSTGALIAPFAFLGRAYDDALANIYIGGTAEKLVEARFMGSGLFGTSLLKAEPLRQMVNRHMTRQMMAAIAAEHRKGRRLLVLTANLDSQRAVVWNIGAIANSGRPDGLALIRDVLVASASVPGVYPAVMIKAEADGRVIEEMHSDGGSVSQVLTLPEALLASPEGKKRPKGHHFNIYVIVNNALMPEFANTTNSTLPVIARAYAILIKSQTKSALMALYGYAQRTGMQFHVASIDRQIRYSMADPFNTSYMRAVYSLGYSGMIRGTLWKDRPLFTEPLQARSKQTRSGQALSR